MLKISLYCSLALFFAQTSLAQITVTPAGCVGAPKVSSRIQPPTLVVDPAGGGDFTEISDAVVAAVPETLILVRAGVYTSPVVIDDQSLKIFADDLGVIQTTEPILVQGVGAGQSVTLSGLVMERGFRIENCAGLVRLQDCSTPTDVPLAPAPTSSPYWEWHFCGIGGSRQVIENSQAVTLVGCEFTGADGSFWAPWDGAPGHHGLLVNDSHVALYDCRLDGGNGEDCAIPPPFNVGGGAGGDALRVIGAASQVRHARMQWSTGLGGFYSMDAGGTLSVACDGIPIRSDAGSVVEESTHTPLVYSVPALLRSGQLGWHTASGPAGSALTVARSYRGAWSPLGNDQGIRHLPLFAGQSLVGQFLPDGTLHRPFAVEGPASALTHTATEMQAFSTMGGPLFWSEPRLLVVVHPSL